MKKCINIMQQKRYAYNHDRPHSQVIDDDPNECDFAKEFGPIEGSVAIDCTEKFKSWKIGLASDIATKNTESCQLYDGLIVY